MSATNEPAFGKPTENLLSPEQIDTMKTWLIGNDCCPSCGWGLGHHPRCLLAEICGLPREGGPK